MVSHTFRNDDVSANTNLTQLDEMYEILRTYFPRCEILSCVNIYSKFAKKGSVYPNLPLKNKSIPYFFNVDQVIGREHFSMRNMGKIVSHGLWHFDHTQVAHGLEEASIVTSCRLLDTDIFVPPFNRWCSSTEEICKTYKINLIKSNEHGWKSFEHNSFSPSHDLWYFHSWKWKPSTLRKYLESSIAKHRA